MGKGTIKTMISLQMEQSLALKELAKVMNCSTADVLRKSLDHFLDTYYQNDGEFLMMLSQQIGKHLDARFTWNLGRNNSNANRFLSESPPHHYRRGS
jgi:hypothetical protein